jgi:hypothetical protein
MGVLKLGGRKIISVCLDFRAIVPFKKVCLGSVIFIFLIICPTPVVPYITVEAALRR